LQRRELKIIGILDKTGECRLNYLNGPILDVYDDDGDDDDDSVVYTHSSNMFQLILHKVIATKPIPVALRSKA